VAKRADLESETVSVAKLYHFAAAGFEPLVALLERLGAPPLQVTVFVVIKTAPLVVLF
jgi:hypothetical protein